MKNEDLTKKVELLQQENTMLKRENEFLRKTVHDLSIRVNPTVPSQPTLFPMYDRTKFID